MEAILIASSDLEEHLLHLQQIFEILNQNNFRKSPTKCIFLTSEINFLGYSVSKEGIKLPSDKVESIKSFLCQILKC